MLIRLLWIPALLGLVALPAPIRAAGENAARTPTLVVRVQSLDDLLADIKYLANTAGQAAAAQHLDAAIKQHFPKGFEGVDTKRPLGLYGRLDPEGNLAETILVALVPIADEKAFLGMVEHFSDVKAKQEDGGVYRLAPENSPVPVFLRFANQYAYVTARDKTPLNPDKLIEPAKVFAGSPGGLLAGTFRLDHIPDAIKNIIVSRAELAAADAEDQKRPGETEAQRAVRLQTTKATQQALTSLLQEGGEVAAHLDVNRQAGDLGLELTLTAKPGSKVANSMAALAPSPSQVAGLRTADAALNGLVHVALPENLRKVVASAISEQVRKGLAKEKNPDQRAVGETIYKALKPTLEAGQLDAALSLRGPGAGKHYTLVAGARVQDGQGIDRAFHDVWKSLPEPDRAKIQLNAETAGSVAIHRINVQKDLDAQARRNLGDNPVYVAFQPDRVVVAGGENGLAALKEALAAPSGTAPQLDVSIALARLAPTITNTKGDATAAAARAFGSPSKGNDRIQLVVEGGAALKVHLSLKTAVLRFFNLVNKPEGASR